MQSTLIICASRPGILYLNGCFAGELAPDEPIIRPVAPRGAVYLDYRPLENGWAAVARKIVFSGGRPMAASVESAENIGLILWPGNISEIEISPPATGKAPERSFSFENRSFFIRGDIPKLYCGNHLLGTLPEGAGIPRAIRTDGGCAFLGEAGNEMYLLTTDGGIKNGTGFLSASEIKADGEGNITAILKEDDFAGHMTVEKWHLAPEGLELVSSEPAWQGGQANIPETAQQTALAAVQALLLGKTAEAEAFFTEEIKESDPVSGLFGKYELCTEMKYAHPDNRPCIALLRLEGEHMAIAEPLYYSCVHNGERYLIESMEFGK